MVWCALFAIPAFAVELPSWFPKPANAAITDVKYTLYDKSYLFLDRSPLPKDAGGYREVYGKTWNFNMKPATGRSADCGKQVYPPLKAELTKQGFTLAHEDWNLQKGEGEHATYVHFGGACDIRIIEVAPNPFHITLKAPAATPETIGPKENVPYLAPIAGSTLDAAQKFTNDVWKFKTPCNDKDEIRVTAKTVRRYTAPRDASDVALRDAYETALKAAGWDVCKASGLTSHYTKNNRDIWSHVTFSIVGSRPTYEIEVDDTGDALRESLEKNCKAALYGVNFDFDKATLRPDSEPALNQILSLMKDEPKLVLEIGGHTDNVGQHDYNMKLSDERAASVKQWLIGHGIAASRLSSHGYGDTQPVVPNNNDENRAKNRRVEVKRTDCK